MELRGPIVRSASFGALHIVWLCTVGAVHSPKPLVDCPLSRFSAYTAVLNVRRCRSRTTGVHTLQISRSTATGFWAKFNVRNYDRSLVVYRMPFRCLSAAALARVQAPSGANVQLHAAACRIGDVARGKIAPCTWSEPPYRSYHCTILTGITTIGSS